MSIGGPCFPFRWVVCPGLVLAGIFDVTPEEIKTVLDLAQATLERSVEQLAIPARVIRKERAVGIIPRIPGDRLKREALDETAIAASAALRNAQVQMPFCAFNGGNDVFVDIGNKSIGIRGLFKLTGVSSQHCLHVGDQFLTQGNDIACRSVSHALIHSFVRSFVRSVSQSVSQPVASSESVRPTTARLLSATAVSDRCQ